MNGARTTFMRKGYLLTALAAAVLLAASSGTAWAQITVSKPATVAEDGTITITLTGKASIPANASATSVTVTVEATEGAGAGDAENADFSQGLGKVATLKFPANPSATTAITSTQSASVQVQTNSDPDAENEKVTLGYTAAGQGTGATELKNADDVTAKLDMSTTPGDLFFTIDDDETQTYVLDLATPVAPTKPMEGGTIGVSLKARPAHVDGSERLTLNLDRPAPDYTFVIAGGTNPDNTANQVTIDSTNGTATITITVTGTDGNRDTDTVTLSAYSGNAARSTLEASLPVKVEDIHALPAIGAMVTDKDGDAITPPPTSVTEGDSIYVVVMVVDKDGDAETSRTGEELTVGLTPSGTADAQDFTTASRTFTIAENAVASGPVMLNVTEDEDVGMEMLVLDAEVSGEAENGAGSRTSAGVLSLGIEDATTKQIEPMGQDDLDAAIEAAMSAGSGDEGLNPGEMFEVMASDLFDVTAGYAANYAVAVSGGAIRASVSGETITVNAEEAGEATVTVTATAEAASSARPSQTVSNIAKVAFDVMVTDKELVVTLEMPDDVMGGNLVEGQSYDIKVMANRAATEDTEVMILMDRTKSDADMDDYSVESAMLMTGETMATTSLMVTEDNDADAGHNAGEALVLFGRYGDKVDTNELTFTLWDEAVPALPLIGQLLLALFLMAGGARLYRRRRG